MKKYLVAALFFISVVIVSSQERHFQVWNQNKLEVRINEHISVGASEKIHYKPTAGDISLKFGDVFIKRQFAHWFDGGLAGRVLWIKDETGWLQEHRPMIFANLSSGLGNLDFEISNRMEYRMYKHLDYHFRHRQMLSVEIPPIYKAAWFKLYVAEEGFIRFDEEKFHLARFYTGTKIKYHRSFEMKMYYVLEKSKKSFHWNTSDILGLNLNLEF